MEKIEFAYEVSPDAGMAHDQNGVNKKAYLKIDMYAKGKLTEEEYKLSHLQTISSISNVTSIKPEFLKPISIEEYNLNHD